jgi:hypothetical protein
MQHDQRIEHARGSEVLFGSPTPIIFVLVSLFPLKM